MQNRQRNKLDMYVLVKAFLLASVSTTDKWKAFAALFATFTDYVTEIFSIAAQQEADHSGVTMTKQRQRDSLAKKMESISEKCRGYATVAEDLDFRKLITFMKGELHNMADAALITAAERLYTQVMPRLPDIADYNLGESDMAELLDFKNQFLAIYTKPEEAIVDTAKLTERLATLFGLCDALLEKMDAIVLAGRTLDPDFYDGYTRMRVLGQAASRTRALQIGVVDNESGLPVAKARVAYWFKSGSELQKSVKVSGAKGGISKNSLDAGEYLYEVSFEGYNTERGSFFVNDGLMTEVIVRLKK